MKRSRSRAEMSFRERAAPQGRSHLESRWESTPVSPTHLTGGDSFQPSCVCEMERLGHVGSSAGLASKRLPAAGIGGVRAAQFGGPCGPAVVPKGQRLPLPGWRVLGSPLRSARRRFRSCPALAFCDPLSHRWQWKEEAGGGDRLEGGSQWKKGVESRRGDGWKDWWKHGPVRSDLGGRWDLQVPRLFLPSVLKSGKTS